MYRYTQNTWARGNPDPESYATTERSDNRTVDLETRRIVDHDRYAGLRSVHVDPYSGITLLSFRTADKLVVLSAGGLEIAPADWDASPRTRDGDTEPLFTISVPSVSE